MSSETHQILLFDQFPGSRETMFTSFATGFLYKKKKYFSLLFTNWSLYFCFIFSSILRPLQFCISKHKGAHIYLEGKGAFFFSFKAKLLLWYVSEWQWGLREAEPQKLTGRRTDEEGVGGQKTAGQERRTARRTYHFCSQYWGKC